MNELGRTLVIAEAGVNHDGDVSRAFALVDVAADAGADAIKFQTFRPDELATDGAPRAGYQVANDPGTEDQLSMLRRLALSEHDTQRLADHSRDRGLIFLSSPFDSESARFLCETLDLPLVKLGSGELTNGPLLLQVARSGKPLILSTGMSTLGEVEDALRVLAFGYTESSGTPTPATLDQAYESESGRSALRREVRLLHCTSSYPCPIPHVNLRAMVTLFDRFGLEVGYSDHTEGIAVALAAVALGATVIEKHITLDRTAPGPDHRASIEADDLARMIRGIRDVEQALGSPAKLPQDSERDTASVARKSLVAARPIAAGDTFSRENLGIKRPGTGMSPMRYWELLGRRARRSYRRDEVIAE